MMLQGPQQDVGLRLASVPPGKIEGGLMPQTSAAQTRGAIINAERPWEPKSVLCLNSVSYSATCFSFCLHSDHVRK